jgi:2-deoxy-D-gluconate 3-dehydrogenase
MILDAFRLDAKVALVTGAASGLGQGMAIGLAEAGADIVCVDLQDAADTRAGVQRAGRRFLGIQADLASLQAIPGVMSELLATFGRLDILVNAAGTIHRGDPLEFTEAQWDRVMDLNAKTVFFLAQAAARQFLAQGGPGKIINIASMLSFQGGVRVPSYTASKSAVMGLTRLLANEWAQHGIHVNALAPGYMATPMSADLRRDAKRSQAILERIPSARWGTPRDMAGPVVFLASAASDYLDGCTIAVDGGWLAR